jgi:hypothetical protein
MAGSTLVGPKVHGGAMPALCANRPVLSTPVRSSRSRSVATSCGRPIPGRCGRPECTTVQIGQDWSDEDHIVVDCRGHIVVESRQLAMVPATQ